LTVVDKRLIGHTFGGNLGYLPGFGKVIIFASFQGVENSRAEGSDYINVKFTDGLLGRCLRHPFGMPSFLRAYLNFKEWISFYKPHGLILSGRGVWCLYLRAELKLWPPPAFRDFRHTGHGVWTDFPSSHQLRWLSLTVKFKSWKAMNSSWCRWSFLFMRDFAMGHVAWEVTSELPIFVSHHSDWFHDPINCRFICWIPGFMPQIS
jgi:hypothetical protein